ncbi:hypothetical protein [Hymenobacter weizhouensis]|uniref:hypothetical protein n=1 Tax=Hymenobacter sp. YIM 151500-1 TaxID=2987689 RepID=UPI0022267A8E|nr:hypothetical protein [Hymenobacter sp. YIM 151500-1]UYZ62612.1 hypothetical protein OIS53_16620 [Hymenobacter sp. YIM 151500-1]
MNENLSNLKKHIGEFTVFGEIPQHIIVPAQWHPLINLSPKHRIKHIIATWSKYYDEEFSVLLEVFRKRLVTIELIEHENKAALLYIFKNPKGDYINYIGHTPLLAYEVPPNINKFPWPNKFQEFYSQVHNGWYEAESHALGLLPLDEFFSLSDMEWGILDDITIDFSLDKILCVFSNSAGGYLCWNFNTPEPTGLVWWDDEEPDFADFWDILDEWSAMGIEEY